MFKLTEEQEFILSVIRLTDLLRIASSGVRELHEDEKEYLEVALRPVIDLMYKQCEGKLDVGTA